MHGRSRNFAGTPSWYATGHSRQLSLLLSARWEMSTGQGTMTVFSGWEGNRRSGVALAMRHRLCAISTYGFNGLRNGDGRPLLPDSLLCCCGNHHYHHHYHQHQIFGLHSICVLMRKGHVVCALAQDLTLLVLVLLFQMAIFLG